MATGCAPATRSVPPGRSARKPAFKAGGEAVVDRAPRGGVVAGTAGHLNELRTPFRHGGRSAFLGLPNQEGILGAPADAPYQARGPPKGANEVAIGATVIGLEASPTDPGDPT